MDHSTAPNPYYIKCYPGLDVFFKSKYISKIIGKLEFWFESPKSKTKENFYKFFKPCQHPAYKPGDSWLEEIGISRKVFNIAFNLVGVSYNSKSAFIAEEDPFQGKLYVKYYDRKKNMMYFLRNNVYADQFFSNLIYAAKNKKFLKETPQEKTQPVECKDNKIQKGLSCSNQNGHSLITYNHKHINPSSKTENKRETAKQFQLEEKMKEIWVEEVGSCSISKINQKLATQMQDCWEYLGRSFENWRAYCRKIASSKFLMGETKDKFNVWFTWIAKVSTIEEIENGRFSLNDRIIKPPNQMVKMQKQAEVIVSQQLTIENQVFHNYLLKQGGIQDYHNWFQYLSVSINALGRVSIKTATRFMQGTIGNRFYNLFKDAIYHTFKDNKPYEITI